MITKVRALQKRVRESICRQGLRRDRSLRRRSAAVALVAAIISVASGPTYPATLPLSSEPLASSIERGAREHPNQQAQNNDVEFEHISLEQGLSQTTVYCILQDSKGFMWFGTQDGLNKYDGYAFQIYKHDPEDPHSLSDNTVRSIYEDRSGALWVGTENGGLDRFDRDTDRFAHYPNDPEDPHSLSSNNVLAIHQDPSGALWIGTEDGLNQLDRDTGRFVRYQNDPDDPHSLSDNHVFSIHQDRSGTLWIGTNDGLSKFDRDTGQFTHFRNDPDDVDSLSDNVVFAIYQDQFGALWIATRRGGLDRFYQETERFVHYPSDPDAPHSLSEDVVSSILEDQLGTLWIGTHGGGLEKLNQENERFVHYWHNPADPHSLSNNKITSLYVDRSGMLWIGTNGGGLNKLDPRKKNFDLYRNDPYDSNSLGNNHVLAIHQDESGALWIGTEGGLDRLDRDTGRVTHYRHDPRDPNSLSADSVSSICQDREGVLWIGTHGSGLDAFDEQTERFMHYRNDPANPHSLSNNEVFAIYEDQSNTLWFGTLGGGLNRFNREAKRFDHFTHQPDDPTSLSNDYVRAIYQDRKGTLWIGTDDGLNKFDSETEQFTRYQNDPIDPHSLRDNFILTIYEDQTGTLWMGTNGGGLEKFDKGTEIFAHYDETDGLPNNVVYGILGDDQGCLWISTNKGISKFDPRTETFRNYDAKDGLQSDEFNGGAYHQSDNGEMFFGGINGFNAFYPENVQDNPYIPPIVLTSLTQGGAEIDLDVTLENAKQVTLRWPKNFFGFEFAALSYAQPEKNQYAYMLQGFDQDWIYVGAQRFGRYTNIPGGTYTLRIKGSNNDGVWNEEGISIQVTVVPPFWQTNRFIGTVVLLLLGSVLGGYRWRVRNIKKRTRELESQVEERTYALEQRTHELEQRTNEIERQRQELEALYRADAELHRHLRLDEVLQALVDIAVDILRADKSSLMVWDEGRERLVVRVARGFEPDTLTQLSYAPDEGIVGHVAATGKPVIVEDATTDPRIARRRAIVDTEGIHSFMQVPIQVGGEVFGVFSADYVQPRAFGEDEKRLFVSLAQRAALAIDTAQLYEQTQELAVVEERNRLARDLHDAVTQTLFSASLLAEILPTLWESDQDEGRQLLKELRQLSRGALAEMRTLLLELRPAALVEVSLDELLRQLAEAVTGREGIPVTLTLQDHPTLPPDVHVALYRIAQEALNNVVKHAQASQVEVSLCCDPPTSRRGAGRRIKLCVSDDGRGFDPSHVSPDCLGLGIIRERAQAVGAVLQIESQPGHGTQVKVSWTKDEGR